MVVQSLFEELFSNVPNGMAAIDLFNNVELYIGGEKVTGVTIEPLNSDTTEPAKIVLTTG